MRPIVARSSFSDLRAGKCRDRDRERDNRRGAFHEAKGTTASMQ